jgi:2-dehydropantoate 2-reductase
MRIAIMGAGGVGGYVEGWLQAVGEDISFVARGAHLEALQRDGPRIESPVNLLHLEHVVAVEDPSEIGQVDLIIFSSRYFI